MTRAQSRFQHVRTRRASPPVSRYGPGPSEKAQLIIGNSMGGMHAWLWGGRYPEFMDALVPMASQPTEMASRNWMMRRLMIETIKQDPGYNNGDYTTQPKAMKLAAVFYATGTNGGDLWYQKNADPERADDLVQEALST